MPSILPMGFAVIMLLTLIAPSVWAQAGVDDLWEQVSSADGIVVYKRDFPGSEVISLRGEATIPARRDDIVNVMKDNSIAKDWVPMVAERRDIVYLSAWERVEFTHIAMPWPLADRYFVNMGKAELLDGGVLRLIVKSVDYPKFQENHDDKVRGVLHYSSFLLTPLADGKATHIRLELNSDPKGLVPKWLVNRAQLRWPRDFFLGLIEQLRRRDALTEQR